MLTIIFFLIIMLGLLINKSKFIRKLQYICIFIVFVFNSWSQDDATYQRIYTGYYGKSHEPGFDFICKLCFDSGISYETFKIVYVSVAVFLLLFALNKIFKESGNDAYSLILLYPLLPLVELLRQLLAIAIITCGIAWYFSREKENIKNKIILALIIFLGATFHYSVLFFLILLLISEKTPQKNTYIQILVITLVSIFIFNASLFRTFLRLLFASDKVSSWFDSANRIGLGIFIVFAFHIISFFIYDFTYRAYFAKVNNNDGTTESVKRLSKRIYSLNVYSFMLFGFYTYNMEFFSRLYIVILILNCFHISVMAKKVKTNNMLILRSFQLAFHITMFVFFCRPFNDSGIMSMILRNNSLFP